MLDKKLEINKTVINKFTFGPLETNCYVVKSNNDIIVIDPSPLKEGEKNELVDFIKSLSGKLCFIIDTHGHFDHIGGNNILKKSFPDAKILIHKEDREKLTSSKKNGSKQFGLNITSPDCDREVKDKKTINFGDCSLTIEHTPGHTKGSISLVENGFIFTGDTLFAGTVGIAREYKNAFNEMINSIKEKILILPDDFIILPGHTENSTIREEKMFNPFLQ
ncbi:MAG: MBL fold metallo-hydrolase [Caldisericota bacterium]|nr:MBL fold metallo-hydrolase [Caldisericota bacterium]